MTPLVLQAVREYRERHPDSTTDLHHYPAAEMLIPTNRSEHRRFAAAGKAGDRQRGIDIERAMGLRK